MVRDLVSEVHPEASRLTVTLDRRFDDLGVGSLELVELLQRIEDATAVAMPSELLSSAETPRDLLEAVRKAEGRPSLPLDRRPSWRPVGSACRAALG